MLLHRLQQESMHFKSSMQSTALHRGHSFLKVNEELLDIYAGCDTSADVIAAQAAHMERMRAGQEQAAARKSASFVISISAQVHQKAGPSDKMLGLNRSGPFA